VVSVVVVTSSMLHNCQPGTDVVVVVVVFVVVVIVVVVVVFVV